MRKLLCSAFLCICIFHLYGRPVSSFDPVRERSNSSISMHVSLPNLTGADTIKYIGSTSFCQGSSLVLTADNAPTDAKFQWQKDGNNLSGATSVSYSATTSGVYSVIVTDNAGNATTYPSLTITVNANPVASFTFTPNNSCGSSPVIFSNTSTGNNLSYLWNFNDPAAGSDSTSTAGNPIHHFVGSPSNGTQNFNVKLTVTTSEGCSATTANKVTTVSPSTILSGPSISFYNGDPYFTQCSALTSATLTFYNSSSNISSNNNFKIIWGDNTADYTTTSFPTANPVNHTYNAGTYSLLFVVTSTGGCVDTGYYRVFIGTNPAVGFATPGNTIICTGSSLTFDITGTETNPPGTIYSVTFNDGTSPLIYSHPPPPNVTHMFNKGSCGTFSSPYSNSFSATIKASNPCLTSSVSVVPIYVSERPKMGFAISPKDTICVNTTMQVSNTSGSFSDVINGTCNTGKSVWSVSPATGWSVVSGSLGSDNGVNNPNVWTLGTNSVFLNFTVPGTYTIKLKGGNQNCGLDSTIRTVCINPSPLASFTLNNQVGCAPFNVKTTNTSNLPICGTNSYQWSVTYSNNSGCTPASSAYTYVNGTSSTSSEPEFQFTNPGLYTISLITKNSSGICASAPASQTVTVKTKPIVTFNPPSSVCQNGSINPTAVVNNCYSSTAATYLWTFDGGTPSSSTSSAPGAITYSTSGNYNISLALTNECGSTVVNKTIAVTVAPEVTVPADQTFCAGAPSGPFTFTSSVSNTTYTWTNTNNTIGMPLSGAGNIASFTTTNSSSSPVTATITVTPYTGCAGVSKSFKITVNPRPSSPGVSGPYVYCLNDQASQLTATTTSGNTVTWYDNATLTGGSASAPIPNTSVPGTTVYYVTNTNTYNCQGTPATIAVTVVPKIGGNSIGSDQTICTNASPTSLIGQATLTGGNSSYSYQWQQSVDAGQTWSNVTSATNASLSPGSLSANTVYRRIVRSSNCSDTSNVVTITVQGTLSNIDISASQTICAGSTPASLTGQTPVGGSGSFTFQWESSLNGTSWSVINGETGSDYQPPILNATTFYRRLTKSGSCSGYSSNALINVNPIPVINTVVDKIYCNGSNVPGINFTSTPSANVTYSWTNDNTQIGMAASGTGSITAFTATNSTLKEPIIGNISATTTYTNGGKSCPGSPANFKVIVLPSITVSPITSQTICTGVTIPSFSPTNDANIYTGSSVTYSWTVSGSGTTLTNGNGTSIPQSKGVNSGSTDLVTTVTVTPKYFYAGTSCDGVPLVYTIAVKPGTPPANAGSDAVLCAADSYTMKGNQPSGVTGVWTQLTGSSTNITSPSSATTTVMGMAPGNTYSFEWALSGFASCPSTKDTVLLTVDADVTNTIASGTQTICAGGQVTINGDGPTGGNGTYSYQWQQSTDNVTWTNIPGQISGSLTYTPTQSVYVRRIVSSSPCVKESLPVQIIVQPGLTNNKISQDQSICINTPAATITGALPSGGDGSYSYTWELSTDGGTTWTAISNATLQDYSPGIPSQTTRYRRLVSTNVCSGPQASVSNVVTVTVNPNAKAVFNPTTTIGCIPFNITPSIINLQTFPLQNSQYKWYVNNVFIGAGTIFPGYTMTSDNDTINIKLVAISAFGCLNDSVNHDFYTFETPQPSFTVSDNVGCGPLTILINNTTPKINTFNYQWSFGNGQTSSLAQPGPVTFLSNPNRQDTVYTIKLNVTSSCNTLNATQSIKVKAKPKALFAPDKSVGCSPMTVAFNNTSLGNGNSYTWDFGDGSARINSSSLAAVSHTFTTGVQDTFHVKLIALNECGNDTLTYAIVVSPNLVHLDFAINGNQFSGCLPHNVQFVNNSSGATLFTWNFGDNNIISSTKNIDTVSHTYNNAGSYTVTLKATNGCSDTTSIESIIVFAKPKAQFTGGPLLACIGDSVRFINQSTGATSYIWQMGDGNSSNLTNPTHKYTTPGNYMVQLVTYSFNAPTTVCTDTATKDVQVVSTLPGAFVASDTVGYCAPLTVNFTNLNTPSVSSNWDFGDGSSGSGNSVSHTYSTAGVYMVTLTVLVPGGCSYITKRQVKVLGPSGTWSHTSGYLCNNAGAYFQVSASNVDSLIYQLGDGTVIATTSNTISHVYANGGTYLPSVILKNKAGCLVPLHGIDSIKVDKVKAGFKTTFQQNCGYTVVTFTDTTHAFFGKSKVEWLFGDGTSASSPSVNHTYQVTGNYPVKLIVTGVSGCSDTVSKSLTVVVYSQPKASIILDPIVCARYQVPFNSTVQSSDAINIIQWNLSNGVRNSTASFSYAFNQAGNYQAQLIVGTANGCYDTTTAAIQVNPTPNINASNDINLCSGSNANISVTGAGVTQWNWTPTTGLSCVNCTNAVASPLVTTPYVIEGRNSFGCSAFDTVVVTVIQPLHMNVSPSDSICIGQSMNLLASGASKYTWSPGTGLNNPSISNPTASPLVTTIYRVVGYDGVNCFTDTAYVVVGVGPYPTVDLGPDLTLPAGTLQPLVSTIKNGPIKNWTWTPSTNLSCANCALPTATIKKNISYLVKVTTAYGCSATDTINIKVFCESSQAFIPNAFTPDGDGINDILMVRGKGIVMVKSFRIFNRWGELVFEKTDFAANDPAYGWDGKVKGIVGGPDVYVYTAEVMCENGATFTYKGNVSIIK